MSGQGSRLAYLTTAYPNVSHTFIRREILELERIGYSVLRVAIRAGEAVVDPVDKAEADRTLHLLDQPRSWLFEAIFNGLLIARARFFSALRAVYRLSKASDRGLPRHLAYLLEALALLTHFQRNDVGHIHVHFGTNSAAVAMLVSLMGGPTFSMTVHGPDEFDAAIGFSLGEKLRAAQFTVAISNYCASQLRRWVPYNEWQKIHVIRCAVDSAWFEFARPVDPDSTTIVSVGRLSAQKGQMLLVSALSRAIESGFEGSLILVGDGEMRAAIDAQIESLGLTSRVTIAGWCTAKQVREYLLGARALILPSFAEGLPVVIMESMALERPALATYIAGIPELVQPNINGWMVAAGSEDELVEALLDISRSSVDKLRVMGRAGASRVRELHNVQTEVARLAAKFDTVVGLIRL